MLDYRAFTILLGSALSLAPLRTAAEPEDTPPRELVRDRHFLRGFIVYAHSWTKPVVGLVSDNHTPRKVEALASTDALLKGWMHLAVTSDPDGVRVYHDGRLVRSRSKAADFAQANRCDLTIGRQGNGYSGTLDGLIDELRLYNRALSGGQIRRLARRGE